MCFTNFVMGTSCTGPLVGVAVGLGEGAGGLISAAWPLVVLVSMIAQTDKRIPIEMEIDFRRLYFMALGCGTSTARE